MKKLIVALVVAVFALPAAAFSLDSMTVHTGKISKDKHGGYSDTQRDYHQRRAKEVEATRKPGYYKGGYHNKSPEFKQGEWQFVESAKGSKAPKKVEKKK